MKNALRAATTFDTTTTPPNDDGRLGACRANRRETAQARGAGARQAQARLGRTGAATHVLLQCIGKVKEK